MGAATPTFSAHSALLFSNLFQKLSYLEFALGLEMINALGGT